LSTITFEFCDKRAREAATAAEDATLANVRERLLRSEAAWRAMADKLQAADATRRAIKQERQSEQAERDCGIVQPPVDWPKPTVNWPKPPVDWPPS
jgi:hypothetical protein